MQIAIKRTSLNEAHIIKMIEALPSRREHFFSDFEKKVIHKYYEEKGPRALASILGKPSKKISSFYHCHKERKKLT